ncbi:MAG: HesB/IscA family protein [Alphaproteobacteria bacterium]|jgi:iron-sulfur cluster insertion protein|nr:iron-sulfur cluster assembly accessory protein [Alphaproteobacteria bacterium]|tara:strand:+ start:843 stop:1169 length:327 start_codon:yes stop_codon:yes gene_type:complete
MRNINITDKAISKIQEVLSSQNMKYFRIKVKGGGCSGFQYVFKSDNEINKNNDLIFDFKSLKILIDKNSIEFIDQAELDYRDELIGSSFSINNPNAKNSCGCGTSFSI